MSSTTENTSNCIEQMTNFELKSRINDLPKGTTDWDSKLLEIINKKNIN
jgi:hypothetical protein